ncbi:MAG: hypothetical protein C0478_08540 [Planctomyces sp.]|nr:hypothetical protein [Planctomyces sp.]
MLCATALVVEPGEACQPELNKNAFVTSYLDFISTIQKIGFNYTAVWKRQTGEHIYHFKETGKIEVDAGRSAISRYHTLSALSNGTDYSEQGATDVLLNHWRHINLVSKTEDSAPETPEEFSATIDNNPGPPAFTKEMTSFPLGILWGSVMCDKIVELPAEIASATEDELTISKDLVDGCRVVEFRNQTVKASLFIDEKTLRFTKMTWEVLNSASLSRGHIASGSFEITSLASVDGANLPITIKMSLNEIGGKIDTSNLSEDMIATIAPHQLGRTPDSAMTFTYTLSDLRTGKDIDGSTFELHKPIPDGTMLNIVGQSPETPLFWRDGKISRQPPEVAGEVASTNSRSSSSTPLLLIITYGTTMMALSLFVALTTRHFP